MKKATLLLCCVTAFTISARCADTTFVGFKKNILYLEFAGKAPVYAVNYERVFSSKRRVHYTLSVGLSLTAHDLSIPLSINAFMGNSAHHVEFGIGVTPYIEEYKYLTKSGSTADRQLYITPSAGYRYQKSTGGFFLRAGISPRIFLDPASDRFWHFTPEIQPCTYVAAGISF